METELIKLVSENECLFNMRSKYYRDQNVRNSAWENISQKLNMPGITLLLKLIIMDTTPKMW